jgi:RNA polymerase sigma factor (sigma-70 family)
LPEREERLQEENKLARFEQSVMPHLDAAYNLARWLVRNDADAEDVVQEATLRAFKFFGGFHGRDGRSWLLTIVRHTCYTWMQQNRASQLTDSLDEEVHNIEDESLNPEALLLQNLNVELLRQAMEELPLEFREVMVLRELEELSYKEIAAIVELPIGTVMSRLSRARKRLQQTLTSSIRTEV